ncbi:hypothetical protein ABZP36_000346 [Zizania latifolia]
MESPAQPVSTALTDELLEEIFLRIGSPADLARTSAACVSFRRLITEPYFLRRYRSLHPPLFLGFVHLQGFEPAQPPHPSAPAARALARAADFSFDYLPPARSCHEGWRPCDARDGLVLLEGRPGRGSVGRVFKDLAACDPLSRRYVLLPPIPDALIASVQVQKQNVSIFDTFLAPCDDEQETTFRVIGMAHCVSKLVVFVFSSDSGQWTLGASAKWDDLSSPPDNYGLLWGRYFAYGCFFWKYNHRNELLMFDFSMMEFSTVNLPPDHEDKNIVIVEAGEGRIGMLSDIEDGSCAPVYYFIKQNKGDSAQEWLIENMVPLSMYHDYSTVGASEGYLLLCRIPKPGGDESDIEYFSLEVKTLRLERVSGMTLVYHVYPYLSFPPSMSPKRI